MRHQLANDFADRSRLFSARNMTGIGNYLKAGAGYKIGGCLDQRWRGGAILLTNNTYCWHRNLAGLIAEISIADRRAGVAVGEVGKGL